MNQTTMEPETVDLANLLDDLIATPVKAALDVHLEDVEYHLQQQHKKMLGSIQDINDHTSAETKRLVKTLSAVKDDIEDLTKQTANAVAVDRDVAKLHAEMLQERVSVVLDNLTSLAAGQQAFREEMLVLQSAAATERLAQIETESAARRTQARLQTIWTLGAGLLGAGTVELLHRLV
jgi:hypothetical protein